MGRTARTALSAVVGVVIAIVALSVPAAWPMAKENRNASDVEPGREPRLAAVGAPHQVAGDQPTDATAGVPVASFGDHWEGCEDQ